MAIAEKAAGGDMEVKPGGGGWSEDTRLASLLVFRPSAWVRRENAPMESMSM